jgi:competence ComEA-like helix-hairpin-helix protein
MKNITKRRMNKKGILIISLFLISFISACSDGQVDINSASAKELDKIAGVGEAIAERIIEGRSYNSVDDLIKVKGIGNATLEKIKTQGIACVDEESNTKEGVDEEKIEIKKDNSETVLQEAKTEELPAIYLNSEVSKDIKTENNKENLRKNLPLYGVIAFCAVFGTVFLIKQRKKRHGFE